LLDNAPRPWGFFTGRCAARTASPEAPRWLDRPGVFPALPETVEFEDDAGGTIVLQPGKTINFPGEVFSDSCSAQSSAAIRDCTQRPAR
jgi:hypothetical protein